MGARRDGRELAVQALYQEDMTPEGPAAPGVFSGHFEEGGPEAVAFARELVAGVTEHRERIDALIAQAAEHWRLPRLSRVDLAVLRLATYELLARPEIPPSVTINEAIEIARRFGSEDSGGFVNGVVDAIAATLGVKAREKRDPGA